MGHGPDEVRGTQTISQRLAEAAGEANSMCFEDTQVFSTKVYPLSPVEQKQLDDFMDENLKSQCVHPSKLLMASLVFFIKKKDGSLCLIQDYQKLNVITVKNS